MLSYHYTINAYAFIIVGVMFECSLHYFCFYRTNMASKLFSNFGQFPISALIFTQSAKRR